MNYGEYLRSEHWLDVRNYWVNSGRQTSCVICGDPDYQLHHKTYERLGHEELDDLEPLCDRHHCEKHDLTYEEDAWKAFTRTQRGYRRVFIKHFGPFALHYCYFCCGKLDGHVHPFNSTAVVVHHQDCNRSNNHPLNLKPAHLGCHSGYHGRNMSAETRSRLRELNRALSLEQWKEGTETRKRILEAIQSPAYAAKQAEVQRQKWLDPEERAKRIAGVRKAYRDPTVRAKRSQPGESNPFYGKSHTPETQAKLSERAKNRPKASCVRCRRVVTVNNLKRHLKACQSTT